MSTAVAKSRELLAVDRCDSCGAQAQVIVSFINGELMFCGHHSKKFSSEIIKKAVSIYDPDNHIA
jgi:hypothetical protein